MKLILQVPLALAALLSINIQASVLPYLNFRSVSVNANRELVGWQTFINKAGMDRCYGVFSVTPEYGRSFHGYKIAQALFGESLFNRTCSAPNYAFKVQGSKVKKRDSKAWLADNFYLPPDYESIVNIDPKIDTFLMDFNFFIGFDTWAPGLFFRAHAPLTSTRWDLGLCESNKTEGSLGYDAGYFNNTYTIDNTNGSIVGTPRSSLLSSFEEFIFSQETIVNNPMITYEPLRHARMSTYRLTKNRLSEIQLALGYNFLLNALYHLGLEFRCYIPTGNTPKGEFLFEAIVGNGHHAELGCGITSHWEFWQDVNTSRNLSFYLDANITHLLTAHQRRTFDLKDKPLSRYMLAVNMRPPTTDLIASIDTNEIVPTSQCTYRFTPVANITTVPVDCTIAIQADIAFKLAFTQDNFQWDIGYDFWARSCEKLCLRSDCCCRNKFAEGWALKGDSFIFGFAQNPTGTVSTLGTPLGVSQSQATIFNGSNNWPNGINSIAWNQNPGIDSPKGLAFNNNADELVTHQRDIATGWDQVYTSSHPIIITAADLDIAGARTKGLSHKFFTHLNYTFNQCTKWLPYVGIGGEVEFGKNCKGNCSYCSISQWGLWLKGGLSFDNQ